MVSCNCGSYEKDDAPIVKVGDIVMLKSGTVGIVLFNGIYNEYCVFCKPGIGCVCKISNCIEGTRYEIVAHISSNSPNYNYDILNYIVFAPCQYDFGTDKDAERMYKYNLDRIRWDWVKKEEETKVNRKPMTFEEIEKKLGFSIKIVDEDPDCCHECLRCMIERNNTYIHCNHKDMF